MKTELIKKDPELGTCLISTNIDVDDKKKHLLTSLLYMILLVIRINDKETFNKILGHLDDCITKVSNIILNEDKRSNDFFDDI